MSDEPKKKQGIFGRIKQWFKDTADWIQEHLGDPGLGREIRADLRLKEGKEFTPEQLAALNAHAGGLDPEKEGFAETVAELVAVGTDLATLSKAMTGPGQDAANISYLLMKAGAADSARVHVPTLFSIMQLLLFIGEDPESMESLDPAVLVHAARGEGLPSFEAWAQRWSTLVVVVVEVLDRWLGDKFLGENSVIAFYGWDPSPDSKTPLADIVSARALTLDIGSPSGTGGRLLVTLMLVPAEHGGPALFVSLGGALTAEQVISGIKYTFNAGVLGALDLFIPTSRSPNKFAAHGDFNAFLRLDVAPANDVSSEVSPPDPASQPDVQHIGDENKTRIDIQKFYMGTELNSARAGFRAGVRDATLIINLGEGDGFLQTVAGSELKVKFDVGLTVDTDGGFRLEGGTKARVTVPVGRSILGVVTVHHVEIGLDGGAPGADLSLEVSGGFGLHIGPFSATVDRLGMHLDATFGSGGNLGALNLDVGFKPPNGVGLRMDFGPVVGGGYLYLDPQRGEYAGALELQIGKIGIKAIGMLTTKLPDGKPGWSLLLFLYAQIPPIPLVFGFTLVGVGGMVGLQHGMNIDALAAGMKTGAFDDLLFPKDPVADAPRILNRLRTLFPITRRALTLGPMVDIAWGTPRIIFLRLAILLKLDNVIDAGDASVSFSSVVLLGQLRVEIGKDLGTSTPVKLIVDILGFWDADEKRYGFLARLRDSKIGGVDIIGSLAVYGEYGEKSRFILAAGGFNPHFTDVPDAIRSMDDRLGASFKISVIKVTLTGYFAITPGTIQFGLNLAVVAKFGSVSIEGDLGGDALLQFKPYKHFLIDFHLNIAVKYKGHSLASVKCVGTIEGPGLWRIKGKATFSILWWDIDCPFDESWGTPPPLDGTSTNVQAELQNALRQTSNWSAQLPAGSDAFVTLAPPAGTTIPLAHPLGRFAFSQNVVPFGLTLERFGSGAVTGPTRFDLEHVKVGGVEVTSRTMVREQFARAQYLEESDDEVLARPSFEPMDAGVEFAGVGFEVPASGTVGVLSFETSYVGGGPETFRFTKRTTLVSRGLDGATASLHATLGAAGRSPLRDRDRLSADTSARVDVTAAPLAVARRDTLTRATNVTLTGQAVFAPAIAAQQPAAARADTVLVEEFELAGVG